ncbi:hypothetical protein BH10BAC1_BH10BAC1_10510 [soil metagenome]
MKKLLLTSLMILAVQLTYAKKVKFAVDMSGLVISPFGMHVSGDFQTLAGFAGGDWMPNNTPLTQETADTNIYSLVVDIPAFSKYEYKFINGDQFYEAEFVPIESRVGYGFDDNRWIYVDSLANDTSFVGAIRFSQNAPKGYYLLRLLVDVNNEASMSPAGTHVAGSFQGWNTSKNIMYKLNDTIDEVIVFIDTLVASAQFKFINGNTIGAYETVPASCATAGNRDFLVPKDTVLSVVCFSYCVNCVLAGISENTLSENLKLYPNPTNDFTTLEFENTNSRTISIVNTLGSVVRTYTNFSGTSLRIDKNELNSGVYFISISNAENKTSNTKLIIQ